MKTMHRIVSILGLLGLAAPLAAAPIRMMPDADPLHPGNTMNLRVPQVPPRVQGTGAIVPVDSPNACNFSIGFGDVASAPPPGLSYDAILMSGNAGFAERFAGQTLGLAGDFDVLSGDPTNPLTLVPGAAGANVDVMSYLGNPLLSPLGSMGFPSFGAVGEGSLAVRFARDQSRVGFDAVGSDGGNAVVEFFRRDGTRLDAIALTGLTDRIYQFRTASGGFEIAGFSLWHDDLAGLALDNVCYDASNRDPDCAGAHADPALLWPPDHRLVPVRIVGVTDPDGDPIAITIDDVTQDEDLNGRGDGNTCPDARIDPDGRLWLRAERDAHGNGRVYVVSFTARDGQGGICHGEVTVCVPHHQAQACPPGCGQPGRVVHSLGPCRCGAREAAEDLAAAPERLDLRLASGTLTEFEVELPATGRVSLAVFDLMGRRVFGLDEGVREAGVHRVAWDSSRAARGLYFGRLTLDGQTVVRRFMVR